MGDVACSASRVAHVPLGHEVWRFCPPQLARAHLRSTIKNQDMTHNVEPKSTGPPSNCVPLRPFQRPPPTKRRRLRMDAVRQSEVRHQSLRIKCRTEIENAYTVLALEQLRRDRGERLLFALAEAVAALFTPPTIPSPEPMCSEAKPNISRHQISDTQR